MQFPLPENHGLDRRNGGIDVGMTCDSSLPSDSQYAPASEHQLRLIIDHSHDAFIIKDLEDRIRFWSGGAERLYGWKAQEALGENFFELLFPIDQQGVKQLFLSQSRIGKTGEWAGSLRQVTKSGCEVFVDSRWAIQRDGEGKPLYVLIANKDSTEKTRLETEFLHAQRVESIGALSGVVAHDLNNALWTMRLAISDLLRKDIDADGRKSIELSLFLVENGAAVIRQSLSLAQKTEQVFEPVDLGELITKTCEILKRCFPDSIKIDAAVATNLWSVRGNATHLYQVLLNLCLNARDAMIDGGKLKIRAGNTVRESGNCVFLEVADTGSGIPSEIVGKIFDPFFTTKELCKGTGLGLFAVSTIVRNHGGVIDLSTEPERGTEFIVYLPAEKRTQEVS